ncbi:MAG: hypothetical protein M1816_002610 [Peltula sp. TS41687]|nr:MAG: hypothetical protein M1816_002610 [Peltula sp. TS41687]
MSANTHWTRSRSVAAEGGGPEDTGQQQESMADPPVQPGQERGRSPTPASDGYDDIELRGDDDRALQRALKVIQKKRRVADLHRQIEAERKALNEGVPLPTITGTIRPRSNTSATIAPAHKRSRRNGSDSEDDSRLRVKDPKTYEGKNQGELDTFTLDCERVFRTRSSQYKKGWRRADYAERWIKPELAKSWNLKVERLGDDYRTWSNLKDYLQNDLRPKALRAKDACSKWLQASQHQNQTVSSFDNYVDQLEKDLPPIPEDMKTLRLMCAFRPEIELAIEQRADIPESRERLITLAINIEGAHKGQRSANPSNAQAASGHRTGGSFKDKGKPKADHKGKEEAKPKERQGGYKDTPRMDAPSVLIVTNLGTYQNRAENRKRSYRADSEEKPMPQGASEEKVSFLDAHEFFEVWKPLSNLLVGSKQDKFTGKFTLTVDATEAFENLKDASLRRLS